MRKLFLNKRKDVGAIGIGAMIVLIAMILVAGVAASVLISTSNTLQSQAMRTGAQTTREVSSGLRVTSILAYTYFDSDSDPYDNITCLAITVEAKPGSGRIDLNNTYILLSDGNEKALLSYNYTHEEFFNDGLRGDLFNTTTAVNWTNLTSDKFAIAMLIDADGSITRYNPVLNRGDKAVLYVLTNDTATFGRRIGTRVEIFGQIIPEIGAPGVISFTSPKAYVHRVYVVQ
ncbi:MAG: flagellin [Candidatus Thermoplasmatota archaeon]|nr:flagellin [Candidatus Thermoplasmatota archaeon]